MVAVSTQFWRNTTMHAIWSGRPIIYSEVCWSSIMAWSSSWYVYLHLPWCKITFCCQLSAVWPLFTLLFVILIIRFVYYVLLKSNMSKAVKILLEGMTDWFRLCWFDLHTAQRKIYVAIQDQIGSDQLSANPFYLFDINPALLLAFFSLTATYIIILLQYKLFLSILVIKSQ